MPFLIQLHLFTGYCTKEVWENTTVCVCTDMFQYVDMYITKISYEL